MKSIYTLTIVLCILSALIAPSLQEEEPRKSNLLLRRPAPRNNIFSKTTTTTAPPEPANEDEYPETDDGNEDLLEEDEENNDKNAAPSSPVTEATTEAVKKFGPIIRPFRSNDDLLNALKKRQQDMKSGKKVIPTKIVSEPENNSQHESSNLSSAPSAPQSKTSDRNARKRFGNARSISQPTQEEEKIDETSTPAIRSGGRTRFAFQKSIRN